MIDYVEVRVYPAKRDGGGFRAFVRVDLIDGRKFRGSRLRPTELEALAAGYQDASVLVEKLLAPAAPPEAA